MVSTDHVTILRFADAAISDIQDINSSFAKGKLKVMYTGENPNGSDFSREVIEAALPSIKNIPIVAHYDAEENMIGGHDMELVNDGDGKMHLRNLTEPCGVVPESTTAFFSQEADVNGVIHNYLVIDPVILWKRQEVYKHIVDDLGGKVDHSMEVSITAYHKNKESAKLIVDSFEFRALCLLEAATPAFAGSELELYSANEFKQKMTEMMAELREAFSLGAETVNAPAQEIDINQNHDTKGGKVLEEKLALLAQYELDAETLGFSLDDFSLDELREKFDAMKEEQAEAERNAKFELSRNLRKAIDDALGEEKIQKPWGPERAYSLEDYDEEAGLVYAHSWEDWNYYSLSYTMDGDAVRIDFASKKRVKLAFVAFVDGDAEPSREIFSRIEELYTSADQAWAEKYSAVETELNQLKESTADYEELKAFKLNAESEQDKAARNAVFEKFEDLNGVEAFEALREDSSAYDLEALENKCFELRGRNGGIAKFSQKEEKAPKIKVVKNDHKNKPYGDLFEIYGTKD